jgi:hypothetical protein
MINIVNIGRTSSNVLAIQQMKCMIGDKIQKNNFENIFVFEFKLISL